MLKQNKTNKKHQRNASKLRYVLRAIPEQHNGTKDSEARKHKVVYYQADHTFRRQHSTAQSCWTAFRQNSWIHHVSEGKKERKEISLMASSCLPFSG